METIKNNHLKVEVSALGADLQSITDAEGKQYLWQGDARYWNRRSPILFPLVGGVWNDTFRIDGKTYHSKRHGFARDREFTLVKQGADRVVYALHDDEDTLEKYPYHFNLAVSYKLEANRIHVVWHVQNTDSRTIHFQIGGHPAFCLPDVVEGSPIHGYLKVDAETLQCSVLNAEGNRIDGLTPLETDEGILEFTEETFKNDALILDHCQLRHIEILNKKGAPQVTVDFKSPAVGIWTPYGKHAPFLCIEPWYGVADSEGYEGEFSDRHLMNHLLPGSSFMCEYVITIG